MADLFEWSDAYHVGIGDIDEQHEELVALLNRLNAAIHERQGSKAVRRTLDELVNYTREHFAIEERLMRESGYPEYEEHRSYHEALIDQIHALQAKLDKGETSITFELLHFLRVWLIRHICDVDQRFGGWYVENGSRPAWMEEAQRAMRQRRWWQFWRARS
ncbi:bacteriohemerythrin [Azoarcus indigens]|uniref:Hemerythrin n=1 Tax=Azoarcus indigens TaxID=29545 RepID=A0A4R6DT68_9RHOO|nr:bacteriohemerythrin [Azoarcus indigens]NMG64407.1 bacteriohemerythrin [Azoarcus indigens]TDN48345.1 hemerythrin [Azoarcus indigens]